MLEEELAKENAKAVTNTNESYISVTNESNKKDFLKKNSQSVIQNQSTSKKTQYRYYVDNF